MERETDTCAVRDMRTGIYGVVAEFKMQGPILLETEAEHSSFDAAHDRARSMAGRPDVIRVAVVRIERTEVWAGNHAVLKDMERLQK